jgi:hypothetical protein
MASPSTERLIAKHRPAPEVENEPANGGRLWNLNNMGLLTEAFERQRAKTPEAPVVVTNLTAWETTADALRRGMRFPRPYTRAGERGSEQLRS